ncbi:unnamed protein product [Bathycoccus prasinos]
MVSETTTREQQQRREDDNAKTTIAGGKGPTTTTSAGGPPASTTSNASTDDKGGLGDSNSRYRSDEEAFQNPTTTTGEGEENVTTTFTKKKTKTDKEEEEDGGEADNKDEEEETEEDGFKTKTKNDVNVNVNDEIKGKEETQEEASSMYIKYESLFDAEKIFSGSSNRQKSVAVSHYINDSLDRLVYGYKHKSNVPLHVSFGQPIERIAVGCGLEEDDWEELEGVGLKERTKVREEMEKMFRNSDSKEAADFGEGVAEEDEKEDEEDEDARDHGGAMEEEGEDDEDQEEENDDRNGDDSGGEFEDDDGEEGEGNHGYEFNDNNNLFYNNGPLPSFGKDLNHAAMYANPTKRKRQQRQHENDINNNKQKMNKNSSMIDAHQFDIAVEAGTNNNGSGDWTDDLSLWAALDHLDTNNNNNNNEIITPQQHQQHHQRRLSGLGVGVSPPNKNKSYAQQANNAHDIATAVSNLPATTQANAVGAPTSGTTIIHHHHHYPSNGSNKNSITSDKEQGSTSSIEAVLKRLEQLEKKFVSHSSKANPREEKEGEEGEENAANTTRKMLFATNEKAANDDNVVNAKSKDENTNESGKNSGGGEMSLLERRVSDLERLLRASELENSTLKRALHFSSQPTNKDSDEKEQNNNKSSAKKKIGATLSHSNAAAGDTKKTTSEDVNNNCYDDSHGLSNGRSDKTNEETLQTLSEKEDKDDKSERNDGGRGGLMTKDKRHPSENIRENAANVDGVSPDSSFYVETNKQQEKTTNTNREEGEENQLGAAKRSLGRELM